MNRQNLILWVIVLIPAFGIASLSTIPYEFISPRSGSSYHPCETAVIVRPGGDLSLYPSMDSSVIQVTGSKSGIHKGEIIVAEDQKTFLFKPFHPFHPGERVIAVIAPGLPDRMNRALPSKTIYFWISKNQKSAIKPSTIFSHKEQSQIPSGCKRTHQRTSAGFILPVDFPEIDVVTCTQPDTGYLFLTNFLYYGKAYYLMILDDSGFPVFFRKMPGRVCDFKKQPDGTLTYYQLGPDLFYAMDSTYAVVDSFQCGNGYTTDFHDLQVLPNGHALLMSYDTQIVDMSPIVAGGDTAASVTGLIIQELDPLKQVLFQWRSWDHFEIIDAQLASFTQHSVDYVHGNAIELDSDGHLLLSSRHMSEITKINRQTGEIIWRWGGKKNEFEWIDDPIGFSYQHDIRRLPNGHVTLFDNGNFRSPFYSRVVEYELDEDLLTARKVFEFRHQPDVKSGKLGNVQRLPNGNTFIGWGISSTAVTEIRPDGTTVFELDSPVALNSDRAFRFPWKGVATAPTLWADTLGINPVLHFTHFGANDVIKFYIYMEQPSTWERVDSTAANAYTLSRLEYNGPGRFRVASFRQGSGESPWSDAIVLGPPPSAVIDLSGNEAIETFHLFQNHPNPFNQVTLIRYYLPYPSRISLAVFNVLGQRIDVLADREKKQGGSHTAVLDASSMSSGLYFYQLIVHSYTLDRIVLTRKMIYLR